MERILIRSTPMDCRSWATVSLISWFWATTTALVSGWRIRSRDVRPMMRSMNGSMISPFSTMAATLMPLRVPQSCWSTMTSWDTSTSLRVR